MTKKIFAILVLFCALCAHAQEAQNNPYIDDRLYHFGAQIGIVFPSFIVTDAQIPVQFGPDKSPINDTIHARVNAPGYGFRVGFVVDLRLCKYLNLRFTPALEFSSRTLQFKPANKDNTIENSSKTYSDKINVMSLPIDLPLMLKFAAEREGNYRPYVVAGGGVSFNLYPNKEKPIYLNKMDYFCEVGFGCDFYLPWFKACPEITYRLGFANQLCPIEQRTDGIADENKFYTKALDRLLNHAIHLTFYIE